MRSRSIENRLFEAAMLVLATTACYRSAPSDPAVTTRGGTSDGTTFAEPPEDPGPREPVEQVVEPPPDPTIAAGPPDANRLCANHKASTQVNKASAKPSASYAHGGTFGDSAYWDANRSVALCSIVRQRQTVSIQVTRTPTCCPTGKPRGHQCPPPYQTTVPGTRVLVEHAELNADGSLARSTLTWFEAESQPEVRRNCGRRPEALRLVGDAPGDDIGGELAAMAELEAASVPAFERLARELAAHGAPAGLAARARAAARDEARHARAMTALASGHGATPRAIEVQALPIRSLEAIAIENAVEGCVREAYGALVATVQAERAEVELRPVFRAIARDERRHAALAEAVDRWLAATLTPAARARVELARTTARTELRNSLATSPACEPLGVPGGPVAVALFDAYFRCA